MYSVELDQLIVKASNLPLSEILPEVINYAISTNNRELKKWATLEANGYYSQNPALTDEDVIPDYRTIVGQFSDVYGRPFIIDNPDLLFINEDRLRNGVAELETLEQKGEMLRIQDPQRNRILSESLNVQVLDFNFSPASISSVLSGIRTRLIEKLNGIKTEKAFAEQSASSNSYLLTVGLHPTVIKVSETYFKDRHFRAAILDSYIALVQAVKDKSGRHDLDGTGLMQTVFSPKKPILRISTDPDEQMGFMWMFSGAVMGVRNPHAHKLLNENDPQRCIEWLSFASALFRALDKAELLTNDEST